MARSETKTLNCSVSGPDTRKEKTVIYMTFKEYKPKYPVFNNLRAAVWFR